MALANATDSMGFSNMGQGMAGGEARQGERDREKERRGEGEGAWERF